MKTVILAGGFGTRISEESEWKPKPMIEIGGKPILWHIMKEYSFYGFNDFIICCGYKQSLIKEWFSNYFLNNSDVTFDFTQDGKMDIHNNISEPWKVTLVDTGLNTMTGGRIKRVRNYIGNETFMLTYGDGVADINIRKLVEWHKYHKKLATITSVSVDQRFGILEINDNNMVTRFREKESAADERINGGYMVLEPEVFDFISGDDTVFEYEPLERIAQEGMLLTYKHNGYWQCMDTKREKDMLEELWRTNKAPWKTWE